MKYTIYVKSTGQISRTIECPEEVILSQFDSLLEDYIAQDIPLEGVFVEQGQVVSMPDKPPGHYAFNYTNKSWEPDINAQNSFIRLKRNDLLKESDWTQLPDVPLDTKQSWANYRQNLRDITKQSGYPFNVVWPTVPN